MNLQAKTDQDNLMLEIAKHGNLRVLHDQIKSRSLSLSFSAKESVPVSLIHLETDDDNYIDVLKNDSRIESLEQDCWMELTSVPNDARYSELFGHQVMQSEQGWDIHTGTDVVVAVSDTGVDYGHEDLRDNMWINTAEQNGSPGVDDDGNGQVDDVYGYDFADFDSDPINGRASGNSHGTHVAGTIAAVGNNGIGVVGVAWNAKIMAVKGFSDYETGGRTSDLIAGVYYAADNGARVINCSWGVSSRFSSQAMVDAFDYAIQKGVVPVVAAGNNTMNASDFSPANIPAVLTVGSSNSLDELSTFSNFGNLVDVIAPGGDINRGGMGINEQIISTIPTSQGKYGGMKGTSMAAPQVAGLATLLISAKPNLSVAEVMDIIRNNGDIVSVTAADRNQSQFDYPRINVYRALSSLGALPPPGGGNGPGNPGDPGAGGEEGEQELPSCEPGEPCAQSGTAANTQLAEFGGCGMSSNSSAQANFGNVFLLFLILKMPLLGILYLRKKYSKNEI